MPEERRRSTTAKWMFVSLVLLAMVILLIVLKEVEVWKFVESDSERQYRILNEGSQRNQERLQNIKNVCTKYKIGLYGNEESDTNFHNPTIPQYAVFFHSSENNIAWCPIYGAGSTIWLENFARLLGLSDQQIRETTNLRDFLREKSFVRYGPAEKQAIDKAIKFMIVRHPFERLLSAYRTILESLLERIKVKDRAAFCRYNKLGEQIVDKYRPGGYTNNIRNILKPDQYIWTEEKDMQPIGFEPSFKEFVNYLIDSDLKSLDEYWVPYHIFCTPCQIEYDVIAKVESMEEDQWFTILRAGLQEKLPQHELKPSIRRNYHTVSREAKVYFSQLNRTDIEKLYQKYQLDFELFQYKADDYFEYATARSHTDEL